MLNVFLIPRYGVLGAATSAVCTEFLGLIQNLFYVSRVGTGLDLNQALLKPGVCVLASVLAYLGIVRWSFPAAWVVSMGVFTGLLLISQTITRDDFTIVSTVHQHVTKG
jgi:O-antigen/teichoic acid export membrane protein